MIKTNTLMKSKTKQKAISSDGQRIVDNGIELVNNANSLDHWRFLDEIEAPMWADLSLCDLTNDDTDDAWFVTCHQFHQCSSDQLISLFSHPTNVLQEPSSPKLPGSVSKSRGKSYKVKEWKQKKGKAISSKQHPVKTVAKKSIVSAGSSNKANLFSRTAKLNKNERPKASSSCESDVTRLTGTRFPKSSCSPSLARQEQEHESSCRSTVTSDCSVHQEKKSSEVSCQTSTQNSGLLSSLRISLRRSCATRPAARVVGNSGRSSEGCKSSSSKSSVGSPLDQGSFGKKVVLGDAQNKFITSDGLSVTGASKPLKNKANVLNVTKAPALNVRSLSNRQGNNVIASKATTKGKAQQQTSLGNVLMPRKVNELYQLTDKETGKVSAGKCTASLASIKVTASTKTTTCQKTKSNDKAAQPMGLVKIASKQSVPQKNGSKKLIGLKEKTNNRSRDKDSANAALVVYFR